MKIHHYIRLAKKRHIFTLFLSVIIQIGLIGSGVYFSVLPPASFFSVMTCLALSGTVGYYQYKKLSLLRKKSTAKRICNYMYGTVLGAINKKEPR